jgi:hypothetical protein
VHWMRPMLVVGVTYPTWTEDKPAAAGLVSGAARGQAHKTGSAANSLP